MPDRGRYHEHMMLWGKVRRDPRWLGGFVGLLALVATALIWIVISARPAELASASPTASPTRTASPSPTPTASPSPTPTASPTPTPRPTASPTPTASPSPSATPLPAAFADDRVTLLVLGSDSDSGRRARGKGYLTDAITVLSVAADGSNPVLVSLPRDSTDIAMPDGSVWTRKVNEIAPTLGPAAMRDTMSLLLGLPIDYYAMIDMDAFRNLVDAVGGVSVSVPYTLADKRCTIGAGAQDLDGGLALCYARHRTLDSDYARGGRHQQLLLALRDRILANGIDVAALAGVIGSVQTDVPASDIPALIELARLSQQDEVQRVVLAPPTYTTFAGIAGARGWISVPNATAIRGTVATMIDD